MTRSRLVVLAGALTVGVGTLAAVGALVLDPARAAVGPLPAEGLAFPADTRVVMGFDVRRMVASPFYSRYGTTSRPTGFKELEERTGLNPERDIDAVYVASRSTPGHGADDAVVLVVGRFDRYKVSRAIETSGKKVTSKNHHGTTVYLFAEGVKGKSQGAVAFVDDDTLIMGSQSAVEATIATRASGGAPLRNNQALTALIEKVKPGSTFWMVGDESLLSKMPQGLPGGSGSEGGPGMALPPLKSVIITGDLDPLMSLDIVGEAKDEAAAKNLADVVRGFVALATLQGAQKPELKQLASAVSVSTEANTVHITGRFSYDALDALKGKKTAEATAPEAPEAPAPR